MQGPKEFREKRKQIKKGEKKPWTAANDVERKGFKAVA